MDVLCNHVGIVEAERFIYIIRNESFDYTKWQRNHYDTMTPEEIGRLLFQIGCEEQF